MKSCQANIVNKFSNPSLVVREGGVSYLFIVILLFLISFILSPGTASASVTLQRPPSQNLGLVGYWTLDGKDTPWTSASAATTLDKSGQGNTGTLTNMNRSTSPTTGKIGQALKFDGGDDRVDVGDMSSMEGASTATWSFWMKRNTTTDGVHIISKTFSGFQISYYLTLGGTFTGGADDIALFFTSGDVEYTTGNLIPLNTWTHVTVVYDGNLASDDDKVKIYINGNLVADSTAGTFPTSLPASTSNVNLGARSDGAEFYAGNLDDVRIYNRALSATEIVKFYRAGQAKVASSADLDNGSTLENGLVSHWTFDGKDTPWTSASAATTLDKSGQGNTGTLTNMSRSTSPTIGKIGQALSFDGVNDVISAGSDFIGTGEDTISAWIYPRSFGEGSFGTIISNFAISLNTYSATNALLFTSNNYTNSASSAAIFPSRLNTWIHVVVTRTSSGTANIYIDGVLSGSANQNSGTPAAGSTNVNVGNRTAALDQTFDGYIDDVRFYNRVLSATEISALYRLGEAKVNSSQNVTGGSLDIGLVGLWSFNGPDINWTSATAGTALDRSGQGNTGTLTNMSRTTSPTIGKVGQGLNFDGGDDIISIANESNFDFERTSTFSVSAWVYRNSNSSGHTIISKRVNGGNFQGWYFTGASGANYLDVVFRDSSGNSFDVSTDNNTLLTGRWYHVVFTYNGNSSNTGVRIYIDGVDRTFSGSGTVSVSILNDSPVVIGNDPPGASGLWGGKMDDVRVYNKILSAGEIKQLFTMGR